MSGTKDILSLLKSLESIIHAILLPTDDEDFVHEVEGQSQGMSRLFQDLVMQPFAPLGGGYASGYGKP